MSWPAANGRREMIVLDTNVISELMRARPVPRVLAWFAAQPMAGLFTTTLTQAEVFYGLALLPERHRRDDLTAAVRSIFEHDLAGRAVGFDGEEAMAYPEIAAHRRRAGQPIAQITAIVASRGARLATRNVRDFVDCGTSSSILG